VEAEAHNFPREQVGGSGHAPPLGANSLRQITEFAEELPGFDSIRPRQRLVDASYGIAAYKAHHGREGNAQPKDSPVKGKMGGLIIQDELHFKGKGDPQKSNDPAYEG
jgi:hypothetical protein